MWMLVSASKEVGSSEQEKQLGENRIILSATILVYSNWRRMASDWHNWFPFQTPQSKACISPFVSSGTVLPPAAPEPTARCSWLVSAVTPWVAASGARGGRGGERRGYHPAEGKQNYQAWGSPARPHVPALEPFVMFLALSRDSSAISQALPLKPIATKFIKLKDGPMNTYLLLPSPSNENKTHKAKHEAVKTYPNKILKGMWCMSVKMLKLWQDLTT